MRVPFLSASQLGSFSDMVRVVACHARDRGSNPVGPKSFFPLELLLAHLWYTGRNKLVEKGALRAHNSARRAPWTTECLQMLTNPLLTEGRVRPVGSALILSSLVFQGQVRWVLLPLCRCSISVDSSSVDLIAFQTR